ncbi:MAG: hypothetical protein HC819_13135 [Cyclobacteriaceae bacterium]|nr:hypothetical protein [Cyclobacteriaceae bacterium]
MKYSSIASFFILIIIAFLACETKPQKNTEAAEVVIPKAEPVIMVYGSENCDHCIAFRKSVDALDVKYTFKDVEASETYYNELVQKIQEAEYKGYVSFPVVEIDGKIYVKPELDEFMKIISQ